MTRSQEMTWSPSRKVFLKIILQDQLTSTACHQVIRKLLEFLLLSDAFLCQNSVLLGHQEVEWLLLSGTFQSCHLVKCTCAFSMFKVKLCKIISGGPYRS